MLRTVVVVVLRPARKSRWPQRRCLGLRANSICEDVLDVLLAAVETNRRLTQLDLRQNAALSAEQTARLHQGLGRNVWLARREHFPALRAAMDS